MKILIIDGENKELNLLKKAFYNSQCQVLYTLDEVKALALFSKQKFDVVITTSTLTKSNGRDLLKEVSSKYPSLVRIMIPAVNDNSDKPCDAHYTFEQPINGDKICQLITDISSNKQKITKDSLVKAIANVKTLPSPPKVYLQLNLLLKENNADSQKIAHIITQDPSLAAKVLQFSNSSAMNKGKPLTNITDAITKMGVETLCCIVMTSELFSYEPDIPEFSLIDEQLHCLATARFAASLVNTDLKQEALLAGLLHDIGKIVLFEINPKLTTTYFKHYQPNQNNLALEQKVFNTNHCHVSAYLLHTWSFSYSTIDAIVNHHSPNKLLANTFGIAQAVYLADVLLREQEPDAAFIAHFKMGSILDKLIKRAEKFKE